MASKKVADLAFPQFYNYPPYFTLQPVKETRERQVQLWKDLILKYCKHYRKHIVGLDEEFPLFNNSSIDRRLTSEAKEVFLNALVSEGKAEWLDKGHRKCLILWRRVEDWADYILKIARENGLQNGVTTVEELRAGDETRDTELAGIDVLVLRRALKVLENRKLATVFRGTDADDEGVKFFGI
eukprot:jgi/Mesen1/6424/ME000329S05585